MELTEQTVLLLSPNPAATANGRRLSAGGKFSCLHRTADGTLYWADCAGSGATPYRTSVDCADPAAPVCRCSCPSRQFPCKHALGLMFEMISGKEFAVAEIPPELAQKRQKLAARQAAHAGEGAPPAKSPKSNAAAQEKRIRKQLEGLDMTQRMTDELLSGGIASLAGSSAQSYEKLARDLGSYYLSGPQLAFSRIALAVQAIQKDSSGAEEKYREALRVLLSLHAVLKRSRAFLQEKLQAEQFSAEDTALFEALGGVWRLEELAAIGSCRAGARLVQLSFDVFYDPARREYIDRGYWLDLDTGRIGRSLNYRPVKALKYVRAEDSCFQLLEIPTLYFYPGEGNRRIRWDAASARELTPQEAASLPKLAQPSLAAAIKEVKNQIKSPLLPKFSAVLVPCGRVGMAEGFPVMEDPAGDRVILRDRPEDGPDHGTLAAAELLLARPIPENSALFGILFYDEADRRICMQPYSLVTPEAVLRLAY